MVGGLAVVAALGHRRLRALGRKVVRKVAAVEAPAALEEKKMSYDTRMTKKFSPISRSLDGEPDMQH